MGKPKEEFRREEVEVPTFGEKLRLLEIGKRIGKSLNLERLSEVLEETKNILLPLVQWLDKPLFPENPYVPKAFQKARGMRLYPRTRTGDFFNIWLERSGKWLVVFRRNYRRIDSRQLAKIMIQEQGYFLYKSWQKIGLAKEIPPIKEIASYHSLILRVLSEFFKSAQEMLEDRQKRLNIMKKRADLLGEFIQSLDPLVSQGKTVEMKGYSIFYRHKSEIKSRYSDDYLCPDSLCSIWKAIAPRQDSSAFEEFVSKYVFGSLEQFLEQMVRILERINEVKSKGPEDRETGDRITLEERELKAIEKVVNSIAAR